APEGAVHVITRYRDANQNLRTQLNRIIARAGLEPWPKLFHNLRASRETELAGTYPLHIVCSWIGNTERIAQKHYLQVPDHYFTQAAAPTSQNTSHDDPKTSQNTSQHRTRTEHAPNEKTPVFPGFSAISPTFSANSTTPKGTRTPVFWLRTRHP